MIKMSKQMLVTNNPQKDTNGIIKYIWLITNKIEQEKSEGKTGWIKSQYQDDTVKS